MTQPSRSDSSNTRRSTDRRAAWPGWMVLIALCILCEAALKPSAMMQGPRKVLIAHRGASAYAPEHTLPAYRLALEQGADYVEQDLQVSKDGVLVCLHDVTLERTTNVEDVFPDRAVVVKERKTWPVADFTLEELKRLDAGAWFGAKFAGERIPTFQEAIDVMRGKAGIYPETKAPEVYGVRGLNMEALTLAALSKAGLDRPGADPRTPVVIQSFSAESLRNMRRAGTTLPLVFLVSNPDAEASSWLSDGGLTRSGSSPPASGRPRRSSRPTQRSSRARIQPVSR